MFLAQIGQLTDWNNCPGPKRESQLISTLGIHESKRRTNVWQYLKDVFKIRVGDWFLYHEKQ